MLNSSTKQARASGIDGLEEKLTTLDISTTSRSSEPTTPPTSSRQQISSPPPFSPSKYLLQGEETVEGEIIALTMVDRASELAELASKNILNHQQGGVQHVDHQRVSLITAGQLFGSGKSFLGRDAPSNLAKNDEAMKLLRRRHKDEELIQRYIAALCLSIDLQKRGALGKATPKGVEIHLAKALYEAFRSVKSELKLKPFEEVFPLDRWDLLDLTEVVLECRKWIPENQYIYIHWDEVRSAHRSSFPFFYLNFSFLSLIGISTRLNERGE
jgi:hypothetical protein